MNAAPTLTHPVIAVAAVGGYPRNRALIPITLTLSKFAAAMRNLCTLINHHIGHAPKVELVKRGNKTLVIPEGTPESQLGIRINKFTRF